LVKFFFAKNFQEEEQNAKHVSHSKNLKRL